MPSIAPHASFGGTAHVKLTRVAIDGYIAIVGSTNRGDATTQESARLAAYSLGRALASRKLRIMTYSDDPSFVESELVRGYVTVSGVPEPAIEVRYPEGTDGTGKPNPPPFNQYFTNPRFRFLPEPSRDWEVSYYSSFEGCGGMLILQGGRSTLVAGVICLGYRKPLIACSGFGGTAANLLNMLVERNLVRPDEKALLQLCAKAPEMEAWANKCVDLLELQADRLAQRRARELAIKNSAKEQLNQHTFVALGSLVIAVAIWVANFDNRWELQPWMMIGLLLLASTLVGCTGGMLWVILPQLKGQAREDAGNIWGSAALGAVAGCLAALLFVAGQQNGLPDLSPYLKEKLSGEAMSHIKADGVAKITPWAMLSSFAAGMTLDRSLAALPKRAAPKDS